MSTKVAMNDEEQPETPLDKRASDVGEIVQQLKSGRKNKSEAFLELQNLLKSSPSTLQGERGIDDEDEIATQNSSTGGARFSKEDRRLLISKLIEKKRQNKNLDIDEDVTGELYGPNQDDAASGDVARSEQPQWPPTQDSISEEIFPGHPITIAYPDAYSNSYGASRSHSAPRARPAPPMPSYKLRDDTNIQIHQRTHKIAISEANIRAEMFKECTFHPSIRPLPSSYGGLKEKDSPFLTRVSRWQLQKNLESTRRKQMHEVAEMNDCTFKPYINKNSQKAAKLHQSSNLPANERLYESSSFIESNKAKHAEDEKARQRQKEDELCTFAPKISKNKFTYVTSRYDKVKTPQPTAASPPSPERGTAEKHTPKECTFTPKIRGVGKSMTSAQLYISTNVVDRLTKPIGTQGSSGENKDSSVFFDDFGDRAVMDVASFMGTLGRGRSSGGSVASSSHRGRSTSRERTGPPKRRSSSAPRSLDQSLENRAATRASSAEREQSFAQFLGRQSQTQLRRQKKVQEVSQQITPKFTPSLNRRSLSIANTTRRGEFLDRYERDLQRRDNTEKSLVATAADPECSFHPQLTLRASKQRARSVYEMSRGDLHKKQTNQKILKLRTEQEELQNMTFQPRISDFASSNAHSVLKLNENPGGFLERYKLSQQQQEAQRIRHNAAKENEELKNCTFTPSTKDCPAYIKRIARSLAVVKAVRTSTDETSSRPQWK